MHFEHRTLNALIDRARRWASCGVLAALGSCLYATGLAAQASDYCDKTRARAASDAALMIAPKLFGQFLRFPSTQESQLDAQLYPDLGTSSGRSYQLRLGMYFSASDAYRGLRLTQASELDCRAHEARVDIERAMIALPEIAKLVGARAQLALLRTRADEWSAIRERARARLGASLITLGELQELDGRITLIERKRAELEASVADLEAQGIGELSRDIGELERDYVQAENAHEAELSSAKRWTAWDLAVTGGALMPVSAPAQVDWYGWVELRYSLGDLFSAHSQSTYLRARAAELEHAQYEIPQRLFILRKQVEVQRQYAERELGLIEKQWQFVNATLTALAASVSEATSQARDSLVVEQIAVQADLERLRGTLGALSAARVHTPVARVESGL